MKILDLLRKLFRWFWPSEKAVKDSWTLEEFVELHGKLQVCVFTDSLGNKTINKCRFVSKDGRQVEIYIAKVLQRCTKEQIIENKDRLFVKTLGSGELCLCREWEDVEITGW